MKTISTLVAAVVLSAVPGMAAADTPAPAPSMGPGQFADAPLKQSQHTVSGVIADWGLDWSELTFRASTKTATLQFSRQAPTRNKQGVYSMGAAQPIALTGKGGNTDGLTLPGQTYAFSQRTLGLEQGTTYYFLITLPVGKGFTPVQATGSIRTEHHSSHSITRRLTGLDMTFTASQGSAFVSISTSSETSGRKLNGSTPVALTGDPIGDGRYRFTHSFDNLTPGTTYYVLSSPGSKKVPPQLTRTSTQIRQVEVMVEKITVHEDADKGLRGRGELLFQVRGTDTPTSASLWGSHYGETKIGSGSSVTPAPNKAPRHTLTTARDEVTVQVEGREADAVTKSTRQFCEKHIGQPHEQHGARWANEADVCYQFSYAQTGFDLRQGTVQTKTFSVARSPELRFTVTVRMVVTLV